MAGFIRYPCDVFYSDKISPTEKLVYGCLINEQNITGRPVQKSVREIAEKLHISKSVADRALNGLIKAELIEAQNGQMSGRASKYFVRPQSGTKASPERDKSVPQEGQKCPARGTAHTLYKNRRIF